MPAAAKRCKLRPSRSGRSILMALMTTGKDCLFGVPTLRPPRRSPGFAPCCRFKAILLLLTTFFCLSLSNLELSYVHGARRGCNAAVVRAESLIQARLLAVADGIGRASHFDEGFAIDPACAGQIPPGLVGRQLSGDQAADLLTLLMIGSKGESVVFAD
jgi:hypothetical protein